MKRFFLKCLLFVILTFVCASILQRIVDHGLKKMTEHTATQTSIAELLSDTINADILIMGNSRALCSYNPAVMESITGLKVWNIGVSGQPFGISHLRYQLYTQHNKPPKLLIINIDNNELEIISNGFGREDYYPYFSDSIVRSFLDIYGFTWKEKYIPMYKYFGDYKLIGYGLMSSVGFYPFASAQHYHGYYNCDMPFDGQTLRNVIYRNEIDSASCELEACHLLNHFLCELSEQQIDVIFCYAPQYHELYKRLKLANCMNVYNLLSERHNIQLLDYSSISWSNDSSYFYNANHVNTKGAESFSLQLAHDISE